ncbi:Glutamine transport ATP-binding protein GlnQ [Cedecea neteri]|uniref:Glutamine transport ATP-binding protein GlnQ n=1 Tax=Cedecea neteri TaxID=158822 RepID=A0A2X2STH5_9ENTR|nr:Glutamine transport ATP-binding protein GlnQ [Cedecea neteri]
MIEFKNVSKHFGQTQVLHNIDLNIKQGEVVVIIGPSGSGKSTLLRCINKLEEITSGDLIVDGLKVNDPKVDDRLIRQEAGMVFQQFYLFPHLTALENVAFGPIRVRGMKKDAAEKLAKELLAKGWPGGTRASLPVRAFWRPAAACGYCPCPCREAEDDAV